MYKCGFGCRPEHAFFTRVSDAFDVQCKERRVSLACLRTGRKGDKLRHILWRTTAEGEEEEEETESVRSSRRICTTSSHLHFPFLCTERRRRDERAKKRRRRNTRCVDRGRKGRTERKKPRGSRSFCLPLEDLPELLSRSFISHELCRVVCRQTTGHHPRTQVYIHPHRHIPTVHMYRCT